MIKIMGLILIMSAAVAGAIGNSGRTGKIVRVNEGILDLIEYIKNGIIYYRDPIGEMLCTYQNDDLEKYGVLPAISDMPLCDVLAELGLDRCFQRSTFNQIRSFSLRLGKSGIEDQKKNCDILIDSLHKDIEDLRKTLPQKSRMYSSLMILTGLGLVLILI